MTEKWAWPGYRLWVLGAADPEMEMIAIALVERGERVIHARASDGARVLGASAYNMVPLPDSLIPWGDGEAGEDRRPAGEVMLVECDMSERVRLEQGERVIFEVDAHGARARAHRGTGLFLRAGSERDGPDGPVGEYCWIRTVDHHRPGDPGYGVPPSQYLAGSSLGQVLRLLGREPSAEERLAAAADHCLGSAYRGECPGVDPAAVMRWRAETRAAFQRRPVEAVLADVESAREALRTAPRVELAPGVSVADLRGGRHIPELPEAAAREGQSFLGAVRVPDGRTKVVLQSADAAQLAAWPDWAREHGLTDLYGGDPARGFAGGYVREEES